MVAPAWHRAVAQEHPGWLRGQRQPVVAFVVQVCVRLRTRRVRQRWWRFRGRERGVLRQLCVKLHSRSWGRSASAVRAPNADRCLPKSMGNGMSKYLVACLALALSACGGGGSNVKDTPPPPPPPPPPPVDTSPMVVETDLAVAGSETITRPIVLEN